jgi:hypothetical protein
LSLVAHLKCLRIWLSSNASLLFFGILCDCKYKSYDLNVHLDLFIFSELEFIEGRNPRRRVVFHLSKKAADLEQVSFCVFDYRKNLIFCRTYYGITFMSIFIMSIRFNYWLFSMPYIYMSCSRIYFVLFHISVFFIFFIPYVHSKYDRHS